MNRIQVWKKAFQASVPVMAGYIVLGFGFGIVLKSRGYGLPWALAMSLFIYAGSMQYAAVSLLAGGASLLTIAVTTLLVNARHLFYGISMIDRYRDTGRRKPYLIFALTDETYSLLSTDQRLIPGEKSRSLYYFAVSLLNQCYWVTGSVLGSAVSSFLPFDTTGIDFSLTALFLTIAVDQWRSGKNRAFSVMGAAVSVSCLLIFGADGFLIPSMLLILSGTFLSWKKGEEKHG